MIDRIYDTWQRINENARQRWRWVGRLLTIAAVIYLVALLFYTGFQAREIDWGAYGRAMLYALGLFFISLIAQYLVWMRMLSFHRRTTLQDVAFYARFVLLRRLPGGVWHWVGRTAMYTGNTDLPGRTVNLANFVEWLLLILAAGSLAALGAPTLPMILRILLGSLLAIAALWLGFTWQPGSRGVGLRILESALWLSLYLLAWGLGGWIFYLFAQASGGDISLGQSVWVWAIAGGSGMVLFIVPGGTGVRELLIAWAMRPYLPLAVSIVIGVLIRITFILGDVLWGSIGLLAAFAGRAGMRKTSGEISSKPSDTSNRH